MWNMSFSPPHVIQARVLTRLPDEFRRKEHAKWGAAVREANIKLD